MSMFPHILPGFTAACKYKATDSQLPQPASRSLCETFSAHYNQAKEHFTAADNVLVGVHTRSVLFLLQLAITTCNQIAEQKQPHIALHVGKDSPSPPSNEETHNVHLHVHTTHFPQSTQDYATYVHAHPPQILVAQMTPLFTKGAWSSAVIVFPIVTDPRLRYAFRAVKCVLQDLLTETGALPTQPIQRATVLACSPWMLAYEARCRRLVQVVTEAAKTTCVRCGVVVRQAESTEGFDGTYSVGLEIENAHISTQHLTQLRIKGVTIHMLSGTSRTRLVLDKVLNGPAAVEALSAVESSPKAVASWNPNKAFMHQHVDPLLNTLQSIFLS